MNNQRNIFNNISKFDAKYYKYLDINYFLTTDIKLGDSLKLYHIILDNNGTLDELYNQIEPLLKSQEQDHLDASPAPL